MTIKSGIDFLPGMAFVHGLVFVFVLCLVGFFTREPKTQFQETARIIASVLVLVGFVVLGLYEPNLDTHSSIFSLLLRVGAVAAPLSVGYFYKSLAKRINIRNGLWVASFFLLFVVWTRYLYNFGFQGGTYLLTSEWIRFPVVGMVEVKPGDFPLVIVRSKEKLLEMTNADREGEDFVYPSAGSGFVRFVLRDDTSYYFVSNSRGVARAFSIRRDLISQIVFLQEGSTSQDRPLH